MLCVLALFACGNKRNSEDNPENAIVESDRAEAVRQRAEHEAAQAAKDAKAAQDAVERLQRDAEALEQRLFAATDALAAAQNEADRTSASTKLGQLRREKFELEARIAEAKARAARAERLKGVKINRDCMENPLAAGCQ
jgi:chromosome segregation ATPase